MKAGGGFVALMRGVIEVKMFKDSVWEGCLMEFY
jgi:hypothetical protein